jgi:unsaturated rhamnogalacturonyl hydrolase
MIRSIRSLFIASLAAGSMCTFSLAQENVVAPLVRVADRIIQQTSYRFVDSATGRVLLPNQLVPVSPSVRIMSDYNDWTYFMGVVLSGMMSMSRATGDPRFQEYVIRDFDFIFDHVQYFQEQWEVMQVKRASYYRIFRMNMLDDCGAMGAALLEAYQEKRDDRYLRMIRKVANYITNVQLRLEDGTLSRPDPRYMTLWADDLYMSVPFLARMGALTGESRYFDDAAHQVTGFISRLRDPGTGLLKHAWFSDTKSASVGSWGRANGWAVMAQVELLRCLPMSHPIRDSLVHLLRWHLGALSRYQDSSGLWHQVLDHPDSYMETSCSAMFCYGMAYAVNSGWIDSSYHDLARRAWKAVAARVRADGQIEGICRGTEVGMDVQYYYARPTPLNDTRGIGAVLLAGAEMIRLERNSR